MVIVWRLRGNIISTALCWIVWHNVHSPQHTYMSSSYRLNRLGLSHWDAHAVRRGGCLELYYCNMVEWFWWDSSLILTTNQFGHLACKNCPQNDLFCVEWDVKPYTLTHRDILCLEIICTCWILLEYCWNNSREWCTKLTRYEKKSNLLKLDNNDVEQTSYN